MYILNTISPKKLLASESKGYTGHQHHKVEKRKTEATLLLTMNSMTGPQLLSALGSLTLKDHSHKWARPGNGSQQRITYKNAHLWEFQTKRRMSAGEILKDLGTVN